MHVQNECMNMLGFQDLLGGHFGLMVVLQESLGSSKSIRHHPLGIMTVQSKFHIKFRLVKTSWPGTILLNGQLIILSLIHLHGSSSWFILKLQ